ncbi:MAG: insulinase family protein [Bacteroidales bacterium]|jgi:predicted Zn-dependent peptidase|nr:insulinase family protein [Bacteroidales bacterium]MDN5350912.1 zinc protease [Bacteroidales bacterium]
MVSYDHFTLNNGLHFYVLRDPTTPMAAMNILYNVGARDEDPNRTGFAHLFEHLMFGGSVNIPKYDEPLQRAGGENNAFTNSDITNYYLTLPKDNLETAFWLESDRMLSLAFSEKSLEVQRQVVTEEFRQNYLNQPYGDAWLLLKPLAYKVHPYQWNTIGKEISHIENARLEDVKDFYFRFYNPNNALIVIAGDLKTSEVERLAKKWFEPIASGKPYERILPAEPKQKNAQRLEVKRNVPQTALYKAYHMCARADEKFYASDLLSDLLGSGQSSRLFKTLVRQKQYFSEINAFITGDIDPGLLIITGKINKDVSVAEAEKALEKEIQKLIQKPPTSAELRKVKNRVISANTFGALSALNKAMNLAYYAHIGMPKLINKLTDHYEKVKPIQIQQRAEEILNPANCSTLVYESNNQVL